MKKSLNCNASTLFVMLFFVNFLNAQITAPLTMPEAFVQDDVKGKLNAPFLECNSEDANSCPYDNFPTKYITYNFHFICKEDGTGNFNEKNDGDPNKPKSMTAYQ